MRKMYLTILLTICMSVFGVKGYAYYFSVENAQGVMIYYNYINGDTEVEVTSGEPYIGDVIIPEEIIYSDKALKVTGIGKKAFYNCQGLTSVTIPGSVTYIGEHAFRECSSLKSIVIPEGVTTIEKEAFEDCSSLTSVTIPGSLTSIGRLAFFFCSELTAVHIMDLAAWCNILFEDNPLSHAQHLYLNGAEITELTIPNGVTSIGDHAFGYCVNITSLTIPDGVTSIGNGTFAGCSGITSLTIPNSVMSIGNEAFNSCGLSTITIPSSVMNIGAGAFAGMELTSVVSLIEEPFVIQGPDTPGRTFSQGTFEKATLYVPAGKKGEYKAMMGWNEFVHIEEGISNHVSQIRANDLLVEGYGHVLNISGAPEGAEIIVYNQAGQKVGTAKASAKTASVSTLLQAGEVGIVKIGETVVKVIMK